MANIYDQASLVMIPSGTKTSKIFSQKPVNGDGDFTFSRSTAATRVNADGNIEKETQNLLLQSNQFDTTWFTSNASVTGGQSGYNGSSDAWLLENNSSTTTAVVQQPFSLGSSVRSFSVYAKAGNVNWLRLLMYDGSTTHQCWFNLTDGSTANASNIINAKSTSIGGGWYRCEISANTNITFTNIYPTAVAGSSLSDLGANIYIQDAQLEQGLVARDYIETTTAAVEGGITDNVPRLDYTDSSCPALLLEPQRTNLLTQSEYFGAWTNYQSSTNSTNEISPEGLQNAFEIIESNTLDAHTIRYQYTFQSGQTYTITAFLKAKTRTKALLAFGGATLGGMSFEERSSIFDLSNGTITREVTGGNSTITDFGNGWYRCSVTITPLSTSSANFDIYIADDNGDNVYQGNGSSGIYIYGAQLEAGSYATSYIPTYGTSVTRNEETCEVTSAEDLIGQTEGTIAGEFTFKSGETTNRLFSISGADWNSIGHIRFDMINLRPQAKIRSAVADIASVLGTEDIAIGSLVKFAVVYTSTTLKMFVNGAQIGSTETLSGSLPSLMNEIVVDALGGAFNSNTQNNQLNPYKQALVFKTALTDQEAIDLTTI